MNTAKNIKETNLIIGLFGKARAWNENRKAVKQLSGLTDKLLSDIGIERFEIVKMVKNPDSYSKLIAKRTEQFNHSAHMRKAA